MSSKKIGLLAIVSVLATVWLYAFAANRKITIPADATGIKLFNGWTATVTYNATCFDSTGAQTFSSNSLTLGSKQATTLIGSGTPTCANGTNMDTSSFINGMGGCTPYTDYAAALGNCGSGYQPCTIAEYNTNRNGMTTDSFLGAGGLSATWSYSSDNASTWNDVAVASFKPKASYNSTEYCAPGSNGGGGATVAYCYYDSGGMADMLCCPTSGSASSCTVEIVGTGHLQSPQFKGNTPF